MTEEKEKNTGKSVVEGVNKSDRESSEPEKTEQVEEHGLELFGDYELYDIIQDEIERAGGFNVYNSPGHIAFFELAKRSGWKI